MPFRNYTIQATAAGTPSGSAVGTAYSAGVVAGVVRAVYFDYSGTATTTDVSLMFAHYAGTIISRADSVTDGWFYPSVALSDAHAGARAAFDGVPIVDHLKLVVSQGSAGDTVTATVVVEF